MCGDRFGPWLWSKHFDEFLLGKNFNAKFTCLFEFGSSAFTGQQKVGVLAHGTGDVPAGVANERGGSVPGQRRQRAAEDEGLAGEQRQGCKSSFQKASGMITGLPRFILVSIAASILFP